MDVESRIQKAIEEGVHQIDGKATVFFRADDIGIASLNFTQLIDCFTQHKLPLCLATVPTWLTPSRLAELQSLTGISEHQWYWHQHGYVHRNFENTGKNQEFGPARNYEDVLTSLTNGKQRLDSLLGPLNKPVFTPPWNRCSAETLQALKFLGFKAISRSRGAKPSTLPPFPDLQVNVDLHTRKEPLAEESFQNLLEELKRSLSSGNCGIMLHHQRMNKRATEFLDILMKCLKKQQNISFVHFGDLII
ncbi:polysaccharide deacetylase family protein [Desulforhopalus sp. 52FAK]